MSRNVGAEKYQRDAVFHCDTTIYFLGSQQFQVDLVLVLVTRDQNVFWVVTFWGRNVWDIAVSNRITEGRNIKAPFRPDFLLGLTILGTVLFIAKLLFI